MPKLAHIVAADTDTPPVTACNTDKAELKQIEAELGINTYLKRLAHEYLSNGMNGVRAVQAIKPLIQYESAKTEASKILSSSHMKEYIDYLLDKEDVLRRHSKDYILSKIDRVADSAYKGNKLQTALNAYKGYGELAGHYKPDEDDLQQYQALIQSLTVNIQDNSKHVHVSSLDKPLDNEEISE